MAPLSPTTILLLVTFCVIVAISASVLLFALTRSQTQSDYTQDLQIYEEQLASRRDFTFIFNPHSGGYNLKRWNSDGSNLPVSESMISIQISPSHPTIFGDEKNEEKSVKVMLTPPTPAKKEKRGVLSHGTEISIEE